MASADVVLLTADVADQLTTRPDKAGQAQFTHLPVGQYLLEVSAPGYRKIQEQVIITSTREVQTLVVSLVPTSMDAGKAGPVSIAPKAVKEAEKALHSLQLARFEDARKHLLKALSFDSNFADANYLMGVLLLRQKDFGQAASYLRKSLQISPEHAPALLALGQAEYFSHDYSSATASFQKFLRDRPRSPEAPVAQKYVDAMRGLPASAAADASSGPKTEAAVTQTTGVDLPSLTLVTPVTETNWAPPDVDDEKLEFDTSAACRLDEVLRSIGNRVQEFVRNVDRFTATEEVDHSELSAMGLQTSHETRKFDYLVEIHQLGQNSLDVQEYRNGSVSIQEFPAHVATVGLPSLVLVFHPLYQSKYQFDCEGRGAWHGRPAWVVHFQQPAGHSEGMLTYRVGRQSFAVGLKGRAWIDAGTFQILAMESDIVHSIPEIRLLRDHQLVEYGPVKFRNHSTELWLPKSADWYCALSGHRYHRRHTFSQFLLFAVDDRQRLGAPKDPAGPG